MIQNTDSTLFLSADVAAQHLREKYPQCEIVALDARVIRQLVHNGHLVIEDAIRDEVQRLMVQAPNALARAIVLCSNKEGLSILVMAASPVVPKTHDMGVALERLGRGQAVTFMPLTLA